MQPSPARVIRENVARTKAYTHRREFVKAIDALAKALADRQRVRLMGKDRYEVDFLLEEGCAVLSNHPEIVQFLAERSIRVRPYVSYKPGQEANVVARLDILRSQLIKRDHEAQAKEEEKRAGRLAELLRRGQDLLDQKQFPKGKAFLRKAAEEYADEPGVMADVGRRMLHAGLFMEAADMLQEAIARFPATDAAYRDLVAAYRELQEFEKAEAVYLAAIKAFGAHPKTFLNMGRLYEEWRKTDKAYEYYKQAYELDNSLTEAKEAFQAIDDRMTRGRRSA